MRDIFTAHTAVVKILTGGSKRTGINNTLARGFVPHPALDTTEAEGEWEGSAVACGSEACEGGDETGGGVLELGSFENGVESRADVAGSEAEDALFGKQCSASLHSQHFMSHKLHPCCLVVPT